MGLHPIIELENISVSQGDNLVLSEVSLSVEKGELIYIVEKTGSGKSSLLKAMYADLSVKEGKASITGFNIHNIRSKDVPLLRRKLGIVFQDFQLLIDRTVHENLLFVLKATGWADKQKMNEQIDNVLKQVGLETKGFKMPHQLSGGEQQRVSIARALLNDPEVILADEPTGNLDPETSEGIIRLLMEISKTGTAVVVATHDIVIIQKFPARTIRCVNGKMTEDNSPVS